MFPLSYDPYGWDNELVIFYHAMGAGSIKSEFLEFFSKTKERIAALEEQEPRANEPSINEMRYAVHHLIDAIETEHDGREALRIGSVAIGMWNAPAMIFQSLKLLCCTVLFLISCGVRRNTQTLSKDRLEIILNISVSLFPIIQKPRSPPLSIRNPKITKKNPLVTLLKCVLLSRILRGQKTALTGQLGGELPLRKQRGTGNGRGCSSVC